MVYGPDDLDLSVVVDLRFSVVVRIVNQNIWEEDSLWSYISNVEVMVETEVHF